MMVSNNIKNGIIVTSDQYSKRVDSGDKNTSLLFGDGASATLMCNKGDLLVPQSFNYGIESMKSNSLNHANEFLIFLLTFFHVNFSFCTFLYFFNFSNNKIGSCSFKGKP